LGPPFVVGLIVNHLTPILRHEDPTLKT